MRSNKVFKPLTGLILGLFGLFVLLSLSVSETAAVDDASLSIGENLSVLVGQEFVVPIILDTGDNEITDITFRLMPDSANDCLEIDESDIGPPPDGVPDSIAPSVPLGFVNAVETPKITRPDGNLRIDVAFTRSFGTNFLANGTIAEITLQALDQEGCRISDLDPDTLDLMLDNVTASDEMANAIPINSTNGAVNIVEEADLGLSKSADPSTAIAGDQLTYTIDVTNFGPSTATNVEIVDTLPGSNVTYNDDASSDECNADNGTVTCIIDSLSADAGSNMASVMIVVDVDADAPDGAQITNTATVSSDQAEPDPDPNSNSDTVTIDIERETDLTSVKSTIGNFVDAGSKIIYDVDIQNLGPSQATNVIVTDALGLSFSFVPHETEDPVNSSDDRCSEDGGTVTCTSGTLDPNDTDTFQIVVVVDPSTPADTVVANNATVSGNANETDPDTDNNSNQNDVELTVTTDANIDVQKDDGDGETESTTVNAGDSIDYTITVHNDGPSDAQEVTVADSFPGEVSFVSATVDGNDDPGTVNGDTGDREWDLGTLAADQTVIIMVTVDVDPATNEGTLTNTVTASSPTMDGDDIATEDTFVESVASLTVTKSADSSFVVRAGTVGYTVEVMNNGPSTAKNVAVTDDIQSTPFTNPTTSGCAEDPNGTPLCTLGDIQPNQSASYTITADVPEETPLGIVTNMVTAQADNADAAAQDTADVDVTDVEANLGVTKTAETVLEGDSVIPGDDTANPDNNKITYTIVVTNHDTVETVQSVMVMDEIPDGTAFDSATTTLGSYDDSTGKWDVGTLAPGQSETLTLMVRVPSSTTGGEAGEIENIAMASGANVEPDPDLNDNTATTTTDVTPMADLGISKSVEDEEGKVISGDDITYTITVTNNGPSDAQNVVVTDNLPTEAMNPITSGCAEDPNGTPTCSLGDIPAGESASYDITVTVIGNEDDIVENTASIQSSGTTDPNAENNTSNTVSTTIQFEANLSVEKDTFNLEGDEAIAAGETFVYEIMVTNDGPNDATEIVVTDELPADVNFVSADAGCTYDGDTHTVTCNIASLPADDTEDANAATIEITVSTNSDTDSQTLVNDVSAQGKQVGADDSDTDETELVEQVDIMVTKDDGLDEFTTVKAGNQITYTIVVTNNGPSDANDSSIVVTDTYPDSVTVDDANSTQDHNFNDDDNGTVTWTIEGMTAGEVVELTLVVTVDPSVEDGADIENNVNAALVHIDASDHVGEFDPNGENNSDTEITGVVREADIEITKSDDPDPVNAGDLLTYTIVVTNNGPSDASNVEVTDILPAGVAVDEIDESQGEADETDPSGAVDWEVGDLGANESAELTIIVIVNSSVADGTILTNTVDGRATETDPNEDNNEGTDGAGITEDTEVTTSADLMVIKVDDNDPAVAGGKIVYSIAVENHGPSDATGVIIEDTLPSGVTFVPSDDPSEDCSIADGVVTCDIGALPAGLGTIVNIVVTVDAGTVGTIVNAIEVMGDQADPVDGNDTDIETTQIAVGVGQTSGEVGPEGLTLNEGDPETIQVEIMIPANAGAEGTTISIASLMANDPAVPPLPDGLSTAWLFTPHGFQFAAPVTIKFTYSDQELLALGTAQATPVILLDGVWTSIPDCDDPQTPDPDPCVSGRDGNMVTVVTTHFSTWALTADEVKVVPITSHGQLERGDSFFVVVESEGDPIIDVDGDIIEFAQIENVADLLRDAYGLGNIGASSSTHAILVTGNDAENIWDEGELIVDLDTNGDTEIELNTVNARSNRNFRLFPGMNYVGLGLIPEDTSLSSLLSQPVSNANDDFEDALGRTVVLADVIESIFVFDPDTVGSFTQVNPRHPCSIAGATCQDPGTPADVGDIVLDPYQGMFVKTRTSVLVDGLPVDVFDTEESLFGDDEYAVPVKMKIEGPFLNSDQNGDPGQPPSKQVRVGFNFVAPHISDDVSFAVTFAPLLDPIRLTDRADTLRKEIEVDQFFDEDDIVIDGASLAENAQVGDSEALRQNVEPEFAYWIFVQTFIQPNQLPAMPTLVHTLVNKDAG